MPSSVNTTSTYHKPARTTNKTKNIEINLIFFNTFFLIWRTDYIVENCYWFTTHPSKVMINVHT